MEYYQFIVTIYNTEHEHGECCSFARTGRTIKIMNGISGAPCVQMAHEWVRRFVWEREKERETERENHTERVHEDIATLFLITSETAKWNYFVFCRSAKCIHCR